MVFRNRDTDSTYYQSGDGGKIHIGIGEGHTLISIEAGINQSSRWDKETTAVLS